MSPSKVQKGTVLSASGVTHASRLQLECRATKEIPDPAPASEPPTTATTGMDQGRNAYCGVTFDIAVSTLSAVGDLVSLGARHSHTGWVGFSRLYGTASRGLAVRFLSEPGSSASPPMSASMPSTRALRESRVPVRLSAAASGTDGRRPPHRVQAGVTLGAGPGRVWGRTLKIWRRRPDSYLVLA